MVPMMCLPMNPNNPLNPLMDAAKQMRALGNVSDLEGLITVNESSTEISPKKSQINLKPCTAFGVVIFNHCQKSLFI